VLLADYSLAFAGGNPPPELFNLALKTLDLLDRISGGHEFVFDQAFYATSPFESNNGSPGWISGEPVTAYNGIGNAAVSGHFLFPVSHLSAELVHVDGGTIAHLTGYDREGKVVASSSLDWFTINVLPGIISIDDQRIVSFAYGRAEALLDPILQ
jgi:hypothetical protein